MTKSNNPTHTHCQLQQGRASPAPMQLGEGLGAPPLCPHRYRQHSDGRVQSSLPFGFPPRLTGKSRPCPPHPARCRVMSHRWILEFTHALGRVQTSVLRRCFIVLHLCTASPRLWVWVPLLHPSPEPKAFHHKAIECFLSRTERRCLL